MSKGSRRTPRPAPSALREEPIADSTLIYRLDVRECRPPAREPEGLAGAPLDNGNVHARQRNSPASISPSDLLRDHHQMLSHRHPPRRHAGRDQRITSSAPVPATAPRVPPSVRPPARGGNPAYPRSRGSPDRNWAGGHLGGMSAKLVEGDARRRRRRRIEAVTPTALAGVSRAGPPPFTPFQKLG